MSWLKRQWAVLGCFVVLAALLTLPISTQLDRAVTDLGDPLLNSWIWAWQVHSLGHPGSTDFFNTNIFFPHLNTLAYSELLLPQLGLAAPAIVWSGNPILAHNLVLLASFVLTAFSTYLLAIYHTGDRLAGLVAGLLLAFCPFMFSHLAHVQILFAGGIPLTFLFLHRWLEQGNTRDAVVMALFYSIQVLGNAYYAVYLTFFAGLYLVVEFFRRRLWTRPRAGRQLLIAVVIAGTLIAPFYSRYFQLKREMGFARVLPPPTPVTAYLATPESNRLYGKLLKPFGKPEARLFPGSVALVLAFLAVGSRLRWPFQAGRLGPILERPALPVLLLAAFWLSLGTRPYRFLFEWIPGFDSLRAVPRIHIMFMFAISLLAAEGFLHLRHRLRGGWRRLATWGIPVLIVIEYLSVPVPILAAPKAAEFPAVYQWLAEQGDSTTFVAYPLRERAERMRVHFSTAHWKRSLNGFSGLIPPLYEEIVDLGRRYPSPAAVADFRALGVDLLLIDPRYSAVSRRPKLLNQLRRMDGLSEIGDFDGIKVYRIEPQEHAVRRQAEVDLPPAPVPGNQLRIRASFDPGRAGLLNDGDRDTVWQAPMRPEEWLEIDLGRERPIRGLELDLGGHARFYPRGYRIEVSTDGRHWETVDTASKFRPSITEFVKPAQTMVRLEIPLTTSRWIRFVQTGKSRRFSWVVAELRLLTAAS